MKKVLHIVGTMDRGGQESFIMNIYRNIDRKNIQFDFIVHSEVKGAYENEILSMGGKIHRVTPKTKSLFLYYKDMKKIFKKFEYSIVHIHTCSATSFLDAQICKNNNIKNIIIHAHNNNTENSNIHRILRPLLNLYSDKRYACSSETGKWCFKNNDFEVIKNGIDTEVFKYDEHIRNKMRKYYNLEGYTVIGHVGRFDKQKNHDFIIDIFEKLCKTRKTKLVLVGDGILKKEIMKKVDSLRLSENVLFLGIKENIADIMNMMDIFLFPSIYEGFGIVGVEAQATGLPVIASAVVPQDINLTDIITYLKLENIDSWINEINRYNDDYIRIGNEQEIIKSGYCIKQVSNYLQNEYQKI